MQKMCIWSLVLEDPTCHGATDPICHNYWAWTLEPHTLQQEKPPQWETQALQLESSLACHNQRKPSYSNEDPVQIKKKKHDNWFQEVVTDN